MEVRWIKLTQFIEINGKRLVILGVTPEISSELVRALNSVKNSVTGIDDEELIERVKNETSKILEGRKEEDKQPSYRDNVRKFFKKGKHR